MITDISKQNKNEIYSIIEHNPLLINEFPMTLDLCLFAVKLNGLSLKKIPQKIHTSTLCLEAIRQNALAIQYVSEKVLNDQLCILAVESNANSIKYIPESFRNSKLYSAAIKNDGLSIQYLTEKAMTKSRVKKAIAQNPRALEFIPSKKISKELFEFAVNRDGLLLRFVPSRNISKKLSTIAISENPLALKYVPERFKSEVLIHEAIENDWASFSYVPKNYFNLENCIDFLEKVYQHKISNEEAFRFNTTSLRILAQSFPKDINKHPEIIRLERQLSIRTFTKKYFDPVTNRFIVEEILPSGNSPEANEFTEFSAFYEFLEGNLKGADLYNYDFDHLNLKKLNIDGASIRSKVLADNNLYDATLYEKLINSPHSLNDISLTSNKEITHTSNNLPSYDFNKSSRNSQTRKFYYISDIHLNQTLKSRFPHTATIGEIESFINEKVDDIVNKTNSSRNYDYLLISGDTTSNFELSRIFYTNLVNRNAFAQIVVVLGNHELWEFGTAKECVEEAVSTYRTFFEKIGIILLHNDLLLMDELFSNVISEDELNNLSDEKLKYLLLRSTTSILGGLGFSGYNNEFNADNSIYRSAIKSKDEDLEHTRRFEKIYQRIKMIDNKGEMIIMTHTPKYNWSQDTWNNHWIYVNGHTHHQTYHNDADKKVYADNQIGYNNHYYELKHFQLTRTYDIFQDYGDGIYLINKHQYLEFNRGMGIRVEMNSEYKQIHMLKREDIYCFLLMTNGKLYFLEGGKKRKLDILSINYYYENMIVYANIIKSNMEDINSALKDISQEIITIGGNGHIHGSIVDIDFYNHIHLDPITGDITPYYATSINERFAYNSLPDLLSSNCPTLYKNYLSTQYESGSNKLLCTQSSIQLSEELKLITDTSMYKSSNLIKSLQYLTNVNVIRRWNDGIIEKNFREKECHITLIE